MYSDLLVNLLNASYETLNSFKFEISSSKSFILILSASMVVEVLDLISFFNISNSNSKELILSANNLT